MHKILKCRSEKIHKQKKKKKTSVGKPECMLGPICIHSQGDCMANRPCSPSGKFIQPGAYSRYTFFPWGTMPPLSLVNCCYSATEWFLGRQWVQLLHWVCAQQIQPFQVAQAPQQVRKVMVQLSMDPREVIMTGSGTCRCLGFGSGWLKYYDKVPFGDLLCIDWCLIWYLLLAWKKKAWKHIVNSLEVQCFKAAVLCWTSLAQ